MAKILVNSAAIRKKDLVVVDGDLNVVEGGRVTVINVITGAAANIFDPLDENLPLSNPFTADGTGQFAFFVDAGRYKISVLTQGEAVDLDGEVTIDLTESGGGILSVTTQEAKDFTDTSIGDEFIISDRGYALYQAVDSSSLTSNEVDILETQSAGVFLQYKPNKSIGLIEIGAKPDLEVGLLYNHDGTEFSRYELLTYGFDISQLIEDPKQTFSRAYLSGLGYDVSMLPDDTIVENLTRAQLWSRAKAASTDNSNVFNRLPYLVSKHSMPIRIGKGFYYTSSGCDFTNATFNVEIVGDGVYESVIATDSDDAFLTATFGLKTGLFSLLGPAYRKSTADIVDKAEYLNSRGISTPLDGQATYWDIGHLSNGFKFDIWMRKSIWCDFSRFRAGGLCGICAARNNEPDNQSNPNAPSGWNSGWYHNQNIYSGAILENQEVGYFGCDSTSKFDTVTAQRQYVDNNDNRILPAGEPPTGIYVFAGVAGTRNNWGNEYGNLYFESCYRPLKLVDQVQSNISGIFTQGSSVSSPYYTPIELDNSVAKIQNTRATSQSFFEHPYVLSNNSVLYGDSGAITTLSGVIDSTSVVYETGSQIEPFYHLYTVQKQNGDPNFESVFDDAPLVPGATYEVNVFAIYNGQAELSTTDTYKVKYLSSAVEPVISLISRDNNGGLAESVQSYYQLNIQLDGSDRYIKLETLDPVTNQYALNVDIYQESKIRTERKFNDTRTPTASETVRRSSTVPGGDFPIKIIDGKKFQLSTCAIRNTGTGWQLINDAVHTPTGFTGITELAGGQLRIDHNFGATAVSSMVITPDETFSKLGLEAGASVGLNSSDITITGDLDFTVDTSTGVVTAKSFWGSDISASVTTGACTIDHPESSEAATFSPVGTGDNSEILVSYSSTQTILFGASSLEGRINYNGSTWVYTGDLNTAPTMVFSSGGLEVSHQLTSGRFPQLTPKSASYRSYIGNSDRDSFRVLFYNSNGVQITSPDVQMDFFFKKDARVRSNHLKGVYSVKAGRAQVKAQNLSSSTGNFWIMALHEIV